jgi:hypothetical protein
MLPRATDAERAHNATHAKPLVITIGAGGGPKTGRKPEELGEKLPAAVDDDIVNDLEDARAASGQTAAEAAECPMCGATDHGEEEHESMTEE